MIGRPLNAAVTLPAGSTLIEDAAEEIFELYSLLALAPPSTGLGLVDPLAPTLDVDLTLTPQGVQSDVRLRNGKKTTPRSIEVSVTLHQDPSALKSRKGDTASCVWRASLYLARLVLQRHHFPSASSPSFLDLSHARILELGAGTGVLSTLLGPLCTRYIATDQAAALPLLRKNAPSAITVEELDWCSPGRPTESLDLILAVDCIFNEALVQSLVDTLSAYAATTTAVLIVMELRSSEVSEAFLEAWLASRRWTVWRLDSSALGKELGDGRYAAWLGFNGRSQVGPC